MELATTSQQDREDGSDFARRMIEIINGSALALLISVGHRTGLFDVMAGRPPSTAEEIAEAAGLSERYVRTWLEAMIKGGIVMHDPTSDTNELPTEHAEYLSVAGLSNLAALAGYVPLLGAAEDRIVAHFQKTGHTPYAARPSFRQLLSKGSGESDQAVITSLMDSILPLVPGLLDDLRSGIDVLDLGCGSGRAINLVASTFPRSRFYGYDSFEHHIDRANTRAFSLGLTNVQFRIKDVADLDECDRYELITDFDGIRDETRPLQVLENIARALRPGGTFLMQEVAALSKVDERLGLAQDSPLYAARSLAEPDQGRGTLGVEQNLRSLLLEAGFESAAVRGLPHHISNCYFVATKGRG